VSDPHDIRNPETPVIDLTSINRPIYTASPEYRRSLRVNVIINIYNIHCLVAILVIRPDA
jgi:hypothetical protein